MKRLLVLSIALAASGCSIARSTPERWNFAVEGKLNSVSAADIAAVVAAMGDSQIYRVRVISRYRVEVDTSPDQYQVVRRAGDAPETHSVHYRTVERIRGHWEMTSLSITVF
jgi:hypothetical protein